MNRIQRRRCFVLVRGRSEDRSKSYFWYDVEDRSYNKVIGQSSRPLDSVVPREGLEPSRYCYHGILSPARLPVPPPRHSVFAGESYQISRRTSTLAIVPRQAKILQKRLNEKGQAKKVLKVYYLRFDLESSTSDFTSTKPRADLWSVRGEAAHRASGR